MAAIEGGALGESTFTSHRIELCPRIFFNLDLRNRDWLRLLTHNFLHFVVMLLDLGFTVNRFVLLFFWDQKDSVLDLAVVAFSIILLVRILQRISVVGLGRRQHLLLFGRDGSCGHRVSLMFEDLTASILK